MVNNNLMIFEGHDVEVFELNGQVLFNPKHVAEILEIADVKSSTRSFNDKQLVKVKNSDVKDKNFRKIKQSWRKFFNIRRCIKIDFKCQKRSGSKDKIN